MERNETVEFCRNIFEDNKLYIEIWDEWKANKSGYARGSSTASGHFSEELIRKHLLRYIKPCDNKLKLITGLMHDAKSLSPQIDIMICNPIPGIDAFLDLNGLVDVKRVRCVIEVKTYASISAARDNILQVKKIKDSFKGNNIRCGIL